MAKIEIDGKELDVANGTTIIRAADEAGIYIPRFCYHKKLSVAANCRMCLVEVEKMGKPQPACATPVMEGMKIFTKSAKALEAQKAVMEFLLINHPLDCPICDQGGQCELQDLAMGFGADVSRLDEGKRAVVDPDLGPLVSTDMTRCIQCTRCVRFGEEIAGVRELGGVNRGEHLAITTYVKETLKSELSGNIIDVCPVGALTSKPFRFQARAWEMQQFPGVSPHDCIGSNLHLSRMRGQFLRVNPRENEAINEVWISDRDRFSYTGTHSKERAQCPMVKQNGEWHTVSWEKAFDFVVNSLRKIIATSPADVGVIASPSSTLEELYLLQKWARALGVTNIDHRLHQVDFSLQANEPYYFTLGLPIAKLEKRDAIFLLGSNIQKDQPIAGLKVRKAQLQGAKIMMMNPMDYDTSFEVFAKLTVLPSHMTKHLVGVLKATCELKGQSHDLLSQCQSVEVTDEAKNMASTLVNAAHPSILLGHFALLHPESAQLQALAEALAQVIGATYGVLTTGANAAGARIAGVLPHRGPAGLQMQAGLTIQQMWINPLKAYVLMNVEPELDSAHSARAARALKQAECVIALTAFATDAMKDYAHVILPVASFGETAGTSVNIEGKWQSFTGIVSPKGAARPIWKVLRVLGNLFNLDGFDYISSDEVLAEITVLHEQRKVTLSEQTSGVNLSFKQETGLERITQWPMYAIDALVRQAEPLKAMMKLDKPATVRINQKTAMAHRIKDGQRVKLKQTNQTIELPIKIDERIPDKGVAICACIKETAGFSETFGIVELLGI